MVQDVIVKGEYTLRSKEDKLEILSQKELHALASKELTRNAEPFIEQLRANGEIAVDGNRIVAQAPDGTPIEFFVTIREYVIGDPQSALALLVWCCGWAVETAKQQMWSVGDKVTVSDPGQCYNSYDTWSRRYMPEGYEWKYGFNRPSLDKEYEILVIARHNNNEPYLIAGIGDAEGNFFIIAFKALKNKTPKHLISCRFDSSYTKYHQKLMFNEGEHRSCIDGVFYTGKVVNVKRTTKKHVSYYTKQYDPKKCYSQINMRDRMEELR